jgi:hypothetical protein
MCVTLYVAHPLLQLAAPVQTFNDDIWLGLLLLISPLIHPPPPDTQAGLGKSRGLKNGRGPEGHIRPHNV